MPVSSNEGHFTIWVLQQQQMVMMLLGKLANPFTGKAERDLDAARWHIDLLGAVEARTKGNLDAEEARALGQVLASLRLNYVEEAAKPESPPSEGDEATARVEAKEDDAPAGPSESGAEEVTS